MSDKVFVDTNVLLYARDVRQPAKQPVAWRWLETLWREWRGCLSFQVLQEYYVARLADCAVLLSEDMRDGLDVNGTRIVNPFIPDAP